MTIVTLYCNKRNPNKRLEIHADGHSHWSVRQFMQWGDIKNYTGDGKLHRWRRENLNVLLEDYRKIIQ